MTPFDYVTGLISIILDLGITQIIIGVADIIHQWERVKLYWPHLLWIVFVFFLHACCHRNTNYHFFRFIAGGVPDSLSSPEIGLHQT
jgi:hypothetical protein